MIYVYGDSHTAGMQQGNPIKNKYTHITWPTYLGEMLNMPIKNMASPGKNIILNVNDLISQMFEIKQSGKIVVFQFQNFFNALLKLDDRHIGWRNIFTPDLVLGPIWSPTPDKGLVVTGLQQEEKLDGLDIVDMNDYDALLTWFSKYESRRMWYEMNKVKLIFDQLEMHGIQCYCFYWTKVEDFLLMDSKERIIKFDGKTFVQEAMRQLNLHDITEETNGEWKDGHLGSDANKILAEEIYNYILNNKK